MKTICSFKLKPSLSIFAAAVVITLAVGAVSYQVMSIYRAVQPIWVEQAAYSQSPMLEFSTLMHKEGYWYAVSQIGNDRHLLQLLVLGALAPSLLNWFHTPLLFVTPIFTVFLGLFGWTVYKRKEHVGYAVVSMLLFSAIAQLTRHNWGLGSGFTDWQSMLLLSSAALCLINAIMEPGITWIRLFSMFLSLAVLARTTSVFYVTVICGPMLVLYFIAQYRQGRSMKFLGATLLNIMVIIAPAVLVVIGQLANMFAYYSPSNASQLRQPFLISAENIFLRLLASFLGLPLVIALIILLLINISKHISSSRSKADGSRSIGFMLGFSEIAIGWWALGFLGFLLANGYTSDVPKEAMYATPALLLYALTPVSYFNPKDSSFYKYLSMGLVVFSISCFGWFSYLNIGFAREVSSTQTAFKQVQSEIARELVKLPSDITWQSYTSIDWGIPVSLITQYEFGEYRQYGGNDYFYNKKDYWDTWYPGLSLDELQIALYKRTANCIDAAVILKDPENQPPDMEDYSYSIASFIAISIENDPNWERFATLKGWPDGTMYQIYLNNTLNVARDCQNGQH